MLQDKVKVNKITLLTLTACNSELACLAIERIELEVHWTGECQRYPENGMSLLFSKQNKLYHHPTGGLALRVHLVKIREILRLV